MFQTSTVTSWCLYSLAKNPEAQQRMRDEVEGVVAQGETISPDHLAQMPYLKAVLKETFRFVAV